ncbi:hypothetical protein LTR24_000941 [Lithohypha guttulata]|uniref:Clr5 domain-containing protein n=1 Tax=Lithohypha guttulata TaxID=1690604 RepID=A0ABR0KMJ0_9EURO|nr:hypothetical protein LTR24_000941 [Lithohypha guttulata]
MDSAPAPALIPASAIKAPTWGSSEYRKSLRHALQKAERQGIKSHITSRSVTLPVERRRRPTRSCNLRTTAPAPELSDEQWAQLRPFLPYHFLGLNWNFVKIMRQLRNLHNIKVGPQHLMRKTVREWGWDKQKFRKMRRMLHKL